MSKELRANLIYSGLTLIARVYDPAQSTSAKIGGDITMTEIGSTANYYGDMAGSAGTYTVDFLVSATGTKYATGYIIWDGSAEVNDNATNTTKIGGTAQTGLDLAANYTAARAAKIDNLDAAVTTRLASSSYSAPDSAATIAAAVWAVVMTGSTTAIQAMRGIIAILLGKLSGAGTNAPAARNIADTKTVVSAVTDSSGNRTSVTLDLT